MKNKILNFISSNSGKLLKKTSIRRALCKTDNDKELFKRALSELAQDGEIVRERGGVLKKSGIEFTSGRITVKEGAFGFIDISESTESIFIPPGKTAGAFSGDTVKVQITDPGNSRGPVGKVVEILEAAFQFLLGQLAEENGQFLVRPIRAGSPDIRIDREQISTLPDIEVGDWVKIEITERGAKVVKGVVLEKVGDAGNLHHELDAVMSEFGLDPMYTAEEELSAGRLKQRPIKRVDLTRETIMTVDPKDAKDFDDALSIHNNDDPTLITIGVHIADVAAYISPNGIWQKKVRRRCFTAYLPGRMVPMLPKVLVTNRCSLIENVEKPAHTVLLHINRKTGKVESFERFHSTIKVKKRLNYEEVQEFADNKFKHKEWPSEVTEPLKQLYNLSIIMRKWRAKFDSFIPLEAPEVRVMCDHNTMELTGLKHEKQGKSNQMVEEYMLATNVAVAKELTNRQLPGIYRVHPEPNPESIEEFSANAQAIYGLKTGDLSNRTNAVNFLNSISKLAEAEVISFDFLRMMQRALYSEKAALHYGLGKGLYSHFTSPIRRLSDLIVHQQLWEQENGKKILSNNLCQKEAAHITEMEGKIDDAYRAAILRFKLYYIRQQMDAGLKTAQAFISRITAKTVKVFIQEFGLYCNIHIKHFDDDYYEIDQWGRYLKGSSTGNTFKCGDKIQVILDDINFARRELVVKPDLGDSPKRAMPKHEKKKPVEIIDEKKSHRKGKSKHKKRKSKNNDASKSSNHSETGPKEVFGHLPKTKGKKKPKRKNRRTKKDE